MRDTFIAVCFAIIAAATLIVAIDTGVAYRAFDSALDAYGAYKCRLSEGAGDFAGAEIYCGR